MNLLYHGCSLATPKKTQKNGLLEPVFFDTTQKLIFVGVLLLHLFLNEITNGGRTGGAFCSLGTHSLNSLLVVFNVFRLDGQVDNAVFAINANDPVSYTHLRAHETDSYLVCRLL